MSAISKLFSFESDPLKTYAKELAQVNAFKDEVAALSKEQIQEEIKGCRADLAGLKSHGEIIKKLTEIRPRIFALTREAAKRSIGQFHYDVQIVGGIVLSSGQIAEMKTGEGKT